MNNAVSNNAADDAMSEVARKDALIKDAKEKMAALDDPVQPDDEWTDVLKKIRKAGWDTRVPAPLVGGLPIGGANFLFLLPSGKRPKQGGVLRVDYLVNKEAAQKFAREHFGWSDTSKSLTPNDSDFYDEWRNLWPRLKQAGWTYQRWHGLLSWIYVRPNRKPESRDTKLGVDYFQSEDDVIQYCRQADVEAGKVNATAKSKAKFPPSRRSARRKRKENPSTVREAEMKTGAFDDQGSYAAAKSPAAEEAREEPPDNSISPIQSNDPWPSVWPKLKASGWTYKPPTGLQIDWTYIRPGKTVENGTEDEDFFLGEKKMKMYIRDKYGWIGAVGDLDGVVILEDRDKKKKKDNAPEQLDSESRKKQTRDEQHHTSTVVTPKVSEKSFMKSPCTYRPVESYSVEELRILLEQKEKEREDAIAAAESLPLEVLERICQKKKLIDLSTDSSDPILPDGSGKALRNMEKERNDFSARIAKVKKEKKEDEEDADELLTQQTLATDIYQGRVDELGEHALAAGVDPEIINEIRHRPLSSGH